MHDINGKSLHIGDEIMCSDLGLCRITSIIAEHSNEDGGALIGLVSARVKTPGEEYQVRTHQANVVKVRTWKELAELALQVQNASNLSGVVRSFSDVIKEVHIRLDAEGNGGSAQLHRHPVCQLFSDKIASLTGTQNATLTELSKAYKWATDTCNK